ncbi:hypothetical protein [Nocardia puris]|uniref:hypothetical protein n=1 Tax=Nocardia puris TaxID=208602 RepID=UPI002E222E73
MSETPTAAEQLAAIDTVLEMLSPNRRNLMSELRGIRERIAARLDLERRIGLAYGRSANLYLDGEPTPEDPANLGALIRAAVESTGATITDPTHAKAEEDDRA